MKQDLSEITISRAVINQQVMRQALKSPATLLVSSLGVLTLFGGVFMNAGLAAVITGILLIPAGFAYTYKFRYVEFSKKFVDDVAGAIERSRRRRQGQIRANLYDLANEIPARDGAGDLAAEALAQFGRIHEKFEQFLSVLDRKLHANELAHARFLGTANQFFMKVMEHLSRTGDALQLAWRSESSQIRVEQLDEVTGLLDQNKAALLAFDQTMANITALKDKDSPQSDDLQFIREQLDELARQAKRLGEV